ncbi:hypothetical protein Tco_0963323 [Tanacetum coccineum]
MLLPHTYTYSPISFLSTSLPFNPHNIHDIEFLKLLQRYLSVAVCRFSACIGDHFTSDRASRFTAVAAAAGSIMCGNSNFRCVHSSMRHFSVGDEAHCFRACGENMLSHSHSEQHAFDKQNVSNRTTVVGWKGALSVEADLSGWDLRDTTNGIMEVTSNPFVLPRNNNGYYIELSKVRTA